MSSPHVEDPLHDLFLYLSNVLGTLSLVDKVTPITTKENTFISVLDDQMLKNDCFLVFVNKKSKKKKISYPVYRHLHCIM